MLLAVLRKILEPLGVLVVAAWSRDVNSGALSYLDAGNHGLVASDATLPAIAAGKTGRHHSFPIDKHLVNGVATMHHVN